MKNWDMTKEKLNDTTLILRTGRMLDNNNAHEAVEIITGTRAEGCKFIVIDMANLEFLSSAGVGSFLGNVDSFREIGGDIILCNVSGTIMHVLDVLDLTDFLTIQTSLSDATAQCA